MKNEIRRQLLNFSRTNTPLMFGSKSEVNVNILSTHNKKTFNSNVTIFETKKEN